MSGNLKDAIIESEFCKSYILYIYTHTHLHQLRILHQKR